MESPLCQIARFFQIFLQACSKRAFGDYCLSLSTRNYVSEITEINGNELIDVRFERKWWLRMGLVSLSN